MREGIKNVLAVFAVIAVAVGVVNFVTFFVSSQRLGGDAINGYARDGHYYVDSHGDLAEVTGAQWSQSRFQARSIWITHPLMMLGMGFLLFGYIFPSRTYRGSRETLAETERTVKASGVPLALGRYGGHIGTLRLSAPLLQLAVYPGGIVLKPVFMPSLAITARDLVAIEFKRSWGVRGCEITHTSAQVVRPLRVLCAEDDLVVAALRALLPSGVAPVAA